MIREYNDGDVSKGIFDPMGMIETTRMTPAGSSDGSVIIVKHVGIEWSRRRVYASVMDEFEG